MTLRSDITSTDTYQSYRQVWPPNPSALSLASEGSPQAGPRVEWLSSIYLCPTSEKPLTDRQHRCLGESEKVIVTQEPHGSIPKILPVAHALSVPSTRTCFSL